MPGNKSSRQAKTLPLGGCWSLKGQRRCLEDSKSFWRSRVRFFRTSGGFYLSKGHKRGSGPGEGYTWTRKAGVNDPGEQFGLGWDLEGPGKFMEDPLGLPGGVVPGKGSYVPWLGPPGSSQNRPDPFHGPPDISPGFEVHSSGTPHPSSCLPENRFSAKIRHK